MFDLAEKSVVLFADHEGQEFPAQSSISMFTAQRPAVSLHKASYFRRDDTEEPAVLLHLKIQDRSQDVVRPNPRVHNEQRIDHERPE